MERVEGEVVIVVRGRSLFRFSSNSLLCTGTRISSGAGMDNTPYCQCTDCPACTKWSPWGPGCWQFRARKDRCLPLEKQRCSQCAELRDGSANKGKGRGSIEEASVGNLQLEVDMLWRALHELRARIRILEEPRWKP